MRQHNMERQFALVYQVSLDVTTSSDHSVLTNQIAPVRYS